MLPNFTIKPSPVFTNPFQLSIRNDETMRTLPIVVATGPSAINSAPNETMAVFVVDDNWSNALAASPTNLANASSLPDMSNEVMIAVPTLPNAMRVASSAFSMLFFMPDFTAGSSFATFVMPSTNLLASIPRRCKSSAVAAPNAFCIN